MEDDNLDNIQEMIKCGQETESSPRLLPCLHSFCEKCLQSLVHIEHSCSPLLELPCMIPCPIGRVPSMEKVRDMKTDFNVQKLIDIHHQYTAICPSLVSGGVGHLLDGTLSRARMPWADLSADCSRDLCSLDL